MRISCTLILLWFLLLFPGGSLLWAGSSIPELQQGTVLVWLSESGDTQYQFVLRIAQRLSDCFFEWEGQTNQGTVYLPAEVMQRSRHYSTNRLFQTGIDTQSRQEIVYWFSRELLQDLKQNQKISFFLDSIKARLTYLRQDVFTLEINREKKSVPVIVASDSRKGEWWILDEAENPLVLRRKIYAFHEYLSSIDTTQRDSLRWIKGKKLKIHASR